MAREVGEEAVAELLRAALSLASKTSGGVIALRDRAPPDGRAAARRPGALPRAGSRLVEQLVAQAPARRAARCSRTSTGSSPCSRWAASGAGRSGARARTPPTSPRRSATSRSRARSRSPSCRQERKGTLLVDVQRRISMYLRALWGREFWLRPAAGEARGRAPLHRGLHDPPAGRARRRAGAPPARDLYRAMAAHAAAHLAYTREAMSAEGLTPLQVAAIGVIEDARVEALAARDFPGLARPVAPPAPRDPSQEGRIGALLGRVARALADPGYEDPHPRRRGRAAALDRMRIAAANRNRVSWDEGVALAHDLARLRLAFHPREDRAAVAYRDDNRYLWEFDEADALAGAAPWQDRQVRRRVSLMEFVNEVDVEGAGDDAQEIWTLADRALPRRRRAELERARRPPPGAGPRALPGMGLPPAGRAPRLVHRAREPRAFGRGGRHRRPGGGEQAPGREAAAPHRGPAARGRAAPAPPGGGRRPRPRGGGARGRGPAPGRHARHARAPALGAARARPRHPLPAGPVAVDQRPRARGRGDGARPHARGRRRSSPTPWRSSATPSPSTASAPTAATRWTTPRFKDFGEPHGDGHQGEARRDEGRALHAHGRGDAPRRRGSSRAAPRGSACSWSSPTGRPRTSTCATRSTCAPTRGRPSRSSPARGWPAFCVSLDPAADDYVSRIFGAGRYAVVDRVERLPERLPMLTLGLLR